MENNKSHSGKHTPMYFFNELIGNLIVCHMTPPDKNIGGFKNFIGKTATALCESGCTHIEILLRRKKILDAAVDACGIYACYFVACFFVNAFVPYGNIYH